jgi:aminodeoxyfutalosine deaminase
LQGKIARGTGMAGFGAEVVSKRQGISQEETNDAITVALASAWESGTNVIGDICNDASSFAYKQAFLAQNATFYIHNFIEIFALRESAAAFVWDKGQALLAEFPTNSSLTLHAPYSASEKLLEIAAKYFQENPHLASIHLLESQDEREIFEKGTGYFADFFQKIGIDFHGFPTKNPIDYIAKGLNREQQILFVHLTEATAEELVILTAQFPKAYFCLCPESNRFIHKTLPNFDLFLPYLDRICLGTDSLASNDSLDMYKEIQAIQSRFPQIDSHTLIKCLTTNGAKALQVSPQFGTFSIGNNCGVVHIDKGQIMRIV